MEIEYVHRCTIICHSDGEVHARSLLVQIVGSDSKMRLRSLFSEEREEKPDRLSLKAELITQKRNDALMEQLVGRLSIEPSIFSVSWRRLEQDVG